MGAQEILLFDIQKSLKTNSLKKINEIVFGNIPDPVNQFVYGEGNKLLENMNIKYSVQHSISGISNQNYFDIIFATQILLYPLKEVILDILKDSDSLQREQGSFYCNNSHL